MSKLPLDPEIDSIAMFLMSIAVGGGIGCMIEEGEVYGRDVVDLVLRALRFQGYKVVKVEGE